MDCAYIIPIVSLLAGVVLIDSIVESRREWGENNKWRRR